MTPAVAFPGKHEPVSVGPQNLVRRDYGVKRAARSRLRAPNLAARESGRIGNADRPGLRRIALRARTSGTSRRGNSDKSDAAAIGTPHWRRVGIDARVEIANGFRTDLEHADERVLSAIIHERQCCPIA